MKITLKKVSHNARLSHETACFAADVFIDDEYAGHAENSGTGGPDRISPRELEQRLEAYAATLPPKDYGNGMILPESAESLIGAALDQHLTEKRLKRLFKGNIVIARGGKVYTAKSEAAVKPGDVVLNHLPLEEAVVKFLECA